MKLMNPGMSVACSSAIIFMVGPLSSLCSSHGLTHMLCLLLGLCLAGGGEVLLLVVVAVFDVEIANTSLYVTE